MLFSAITILRYHNKRRDTIKFSEGTDKLNQYTGLGEENKVRSKYLVGT